MKLNRLKKLYDDIILETLNEVLVLGCYYYHLGKWHDILETPILQPIIEQLNNSTHAEIAYRQKSSTHAYFYFNELDFTLCIGFLKAPKKQTLEKIRRRIDNICEASLNAYKIAHNPLTELLAKEAFNTSLNLAIEEIKSSFSSSPDAQEPILPRAIAVLALDIDHFKQVNDTWGHYYGDQVLKAFGRRLESIASSIQAEGDGSPTVILGHPSGEEFLSIISANASKEQFIEWCSLFRTKISDNVLPTDSEWDLLISEAHPDGVELPALQDRSITASIGVTWHTNFTNIGSDSKLAAILLERADTALYRAKAAGRNQVIFYDEILASCGRIIEHDKSTGVIAIDIGSNVGVTIGQEFKVYPPSFTGQKKFTINDGRTTRTLGTYPRVESGRLVVFNTQPEISFACTSPHDSTEPIFEIGSHLEAIPAGSIRHLLPTFSRYFSNSEDRDQGDIQAIQTYLEKASTDGRTPFSAVFRFSRESEYSKKYGTAALNYALARLFKFAKSTFHAARYVEVLDSSSICVIGENKAYKEKMMEDFLKEISEDLPELGTLAGIFCKADRDREHKESSISLNYTNAIDFARFASSELGREPDVKIRHFGHRTAYDVLQAYRDARSYKIAYADYEKLSALGVKSGSLENLAGLVTGSLGLKKQALEHYESAIEMSPSTLIYKSNYCTAALRLGEIEASLNVMNPIPLEDIDRLLSLHPYGYGCYATALARAASTGSKLFSKDRFAHIALNALSLTEEISESNRSLISSILENL